MALFRCSKCNHLREVGNDYLGKSVKCPKCSEISTIFNTVTFVDALIKKHLLLKKEFINLHQQLEQKGDLDIEVIGIEPAEEIDIYNTTSLTQAENYEPIIQWFQKRHIEIEINQESVDTTGFFDEVALQLGSNFSVLHSVSDHIKYIQNKKYTNAKLELSKKSPQEIKQITTFCKEMYDYSFVAKYFYQKNEKIVRLTLQTAPKIRQFFNGIWMEWFIFIKLLELFRDKNIAASCMRSLNISFSDGTSHELDIFFLTEKGIPVYIECKSGEFRQDIDKYLKLRKRLTLGKGQFIICVFGLSQEQTTGMTSMYDITFTNEITLMHHINNII